MPDNTQPEDSQQADTREPNLAADSSDEVSKFASGWSWGAFMFDAPFLIAIRKYTYLLVYLLMLIPLLNFIVYIGFKIYLGIKGREMAEDSDTFDSSAEREGFFKGFDWAGKVIFFIMLAVFVLGAIVTVVTGLSISSAIDPAGNLPR